MILIRGAEVYRGIGFEKADVLIEGPIVRTVGQVAPARDHRIIEADGMVLGPGLVDLHVHFRDPGHTWKEDLQTGTRAAAAGGFTAVVMMPNTDPPIDTPARVRDLRERSDAAAGIHVAVAGAVTEGRRGRALVDIEGMYHAGVRVFSDDGDPVAESALLRKAMSSMAELPGAVLADHPEQVHPIDRGHLHQGARAGAHGMVGPPAESESQVIERDIAVAEETSGRLHVQHVSTRLGVELIAQAKDRRIPVTAEVTPHHLTLTVDSLETPDTNLKMYPPLREEADRLALVDGLREGVIDAVATDHAPHSKEEKAVGFGDAPRGVIGLETALPLALDALEGDLLLLFERMSVAPARIAGLGAQGRSVEPGAPASLVLIDPGVQWTPTRFASKSSNSPFIGRKLRGKVVLTVHGGKIAYQAEAPSA